MRYRQIAATPSLDLGNSTQKERLAVLRLSKLQAVKATLRFALSLEEKTTF